MDLAGIRVVDLSQLLPGPYATQLLADMGADVVKVEPPGRGDYARLYEDGWPAYIFPAVNNGKRSVTLDLQQEPARDALYAMVETADVVVEQFRPGVVNRLGVDYETLREYNEDIVYCSITAFGQTGPYEARVGHDLSFQGFAGLLDMTRLDDDERPRIPGYPVGDMTSGFVAATSILGALLSRELGDAGGDYIDVSMTDAVTALGAVDVAMADAGEDPHPGATAVTGKYACYNVYETADGEYVTLAASEPKFWRAFCEAVGREELIEHHWSDDPETRTRVREAVAAEFAERPRAEWEAEFGSRDDMAVGLVNSPADILENPQFEERDLLRTTADGHRRLGFPAQVADRDHDDATTLPGLGEHTETILREVGLDDSAISTLREADAI